MKVLTEKQRTKANNIRESCAGYIGGKYIASWATDEQIIRLCFGFLLFKAYVSNIGVHIVPATLKFIANLS